MITAAQCRAARGPSGVESRPISRNSPVGIVTVHQFEADASQPRRATVDVVRRAFEAAGVEFIEENGGGPGVRLRKRIHKKPGKPA